MIKAASIQQGFDKAVSDGSSFFVYRLPGKGIETADLSSSVGYRIKPWIGSADISKRTFNSEAVDLPRETSREEYDQAFGRYQAAFHSGELRKAILSTVICEEKPDGFDPLEFFFRLCGQYPDAFCYLLHHSGAGTWCGATPEVLLAGSGTDFTTVALAGTQQKDAEGQYAWGEKEEEEQELVCEHIREVLKENNAERIIESAPYTAEAGAVAHLKTDFRFQYSGRIDGLLKCLHPTPAVAGLPVGRSMKLINEVEKHDRGLYTGYIGVISNAETRVYVNLRCMQIGTDDIALYTGGGITAKSNADAEWEETRLKAKTLLNLLKSNA